MKYMKINISKFLSLVMVGLIVLSFSACQDIKINMSSNNQTTGSETQPTTEKPFVNEIDLSQLHTYDAEDGDYFAGVWQIISGAGSQLENFKYIFDGNGKAILIVGTTGYSGSYTFTYENLDSSDTTEDMAPVDQYGNPVEEGYDDEENKVEIFSCQLMFGINGSYTFEFGEDEIHLTNIDSEEQTVIKKVEDFNVVPTPDENAVIDEKILGAWMSESGEYYYFDKNGVMYNNQYGTMFTYGTYSAVDNKITFTYSMEVDKETTDNYTYSFEGETLVINDYKYNKISADELV